MYSLSSELSSKAPVLAVCNYSFYCYLNISSIATKIVRISFKIKILLYFCPVSVSRLSVFEIEVLCKIHKNQYESAITNHKSNGIPMTSQIKKYHIDIVLGKYSNDAKSC